MFTVNCDQVLRILTEKHKALATSILDIISQRTQVGLAEVAAGFEQIQKKLVERSSSIEDLMAQKQCILLSLVLA